MIAAVLAVIVAGVVAITMLRGGDQVQLLTSSSSTTAPGSNAAVSNAAGSTPTTDPAPIASPPLTTPTSVSSTTTQPPTSTTELQPAGTTTTTSTTTTVTPVVDVVACQNEVQNYRLEYPATWSAERDDPVWGCGLFDPDPFELIPNSEVPAVAIVIDLLPGVYEENRSIVADPVPDIVIGTPESRLIGGRLAICAVAEATEGSYFDAGTTRSSCLADWGDDSLLIDAIAWWWLDADEVFDVAQAMLDTIEPITPLPFRD